MKKYFCFLLAAFSLILFTNGICHANEYNEQVVFDFADLLDDTEEDTLRDQAEQYEELDVSLVFLTIDDANGVSSRTYSDDFYDTHNFRSNGVLFMIDMDNREIYVNTVGTCIDALDSEIESILDTGFAYVSDGDYYDCLFEMSEHAYSIMAEKDFPGMLFTPLLPALIITIIILVILVVIHNKANRQISASQYMGSSFTVKNRNAMYLGCRREVLHGYYRKNESSHRSSRGISHGGGGRKF